MPGPRRCFATAKALQRLEAGLLCEVLMKFPEYLKERGLKLPANPTQDNLDYEAIRAACMCGDQAVFQAAKLFKTCRPRRPDFSG